MLDASTIQSKKVRASKRLHFHLFNFGSINHHLTAYALVLNQSILGKRIFFFTRGSWELSQTGKDCLYIKDDDILLRIQLDKGIVDHIDVETHRGWEILEFSDQGNSALVHFKTYPDDTIKLNSFKFKKGYKKVRGHMLPSGGFINLNQRKEMLEFIHSYFISESSPI